MKLPQGLKNNNIKTLTQIMYILFLITGLAFCRTPQEKKYKASCTEGQCESGTGTWVYDNGYKYVGQFQDGVPHGNGTLTFEKGDKVGQFPDLVLLEILKSNGDRYVGEFASGLPYGKGALTSIDGVTRDGEWNYGMPTGLFQVTDKAKSKLPMEYYDKYKSSPLYKLSGEVDKTGTGDCHISYLVGDSYEGNCKNFLREGKGTYIWKDGDRYVGEWKKGHMEGKGILYNKNGSIRYSGEFKDGDNDISRIESNFTFLFLCQAASGETCQNFFTPYNENQLGFPSAADSAVQNCTKSKGKAIKSRCSTENEIGRCVLAKKRENDSLASLFSGDDFISIKSYYNASDFEKGKKNECEKGKWLTFQ